MNKKRNGIYIIVFFILILAIWLSMSLFAQPTQINLHAAKGYYNLSNKDFTNHVYRVENDWESWPEVLYTPDDFSSGKVKDMPQFISSEEYKNVPYATHKLRMTIPKNQTYGITMQTSEYAMRLYIDGVEIDSIGSPGTTREKTEHRVLERTYYFTTQSGEVEFIVQAANFVHAKGGSWAPRFHIGFEQTITQWNNANLAVNYMVVGCLITAFLYHLGLFCLNRKRKIVFIFSLCCLLLTFLNKKLILMFWPNYIWNIGIRIEYLFHFLTFAMIVLFLDKLHSKLLKRWVINSYYVLTGVYIMTLLLDSTIFTGLLLYFEIVSVLMICYILIALALQLKTGKLINWVSFIGILVLGVLGANDILYYRGFVLIPPISGQFFMTPIGMVFFVFCYALVLSIEYAETERSMIASKEREQCLATENATLDRMNHLRSELMETISHEARTPLAVLASYSGLVSMELKDKGVDKQTASDLDKIAFEAKRVANLIDGMKNLTLNSVETAERVILDISSVITQTARLYLPILERKGVILNIGSDNMLPPVFGNPEQLTQVVFNLLQNAKNHTIFGSIDITVKQEGSYVSVGLRDTGEGIPPEILTHIFEKGVYGREGGTGIGLTICKEIIESHGGKIKVESNLGKGTLVTFKIPIYKEVMYGV